LEQDLVEKLWTDRPSKPTTPVSLFHYEVFLSFMKIFVFDVQYCGRSAQDKFKDIAERLKETGASTYIVTNLEEIACIIKEKGIN